MSLRIFFIGFIGLGLGACHSGTDGGFPTFVPDPFTFSLSALPDGLDEGQATNLAVTLLEGPSDLRAPVFEVVIEAGADTVAILDDENQPGQWQLKSGHVDVDTVIKGHVVGTYEGQRHAAAFSLTIRNYDRAPGVSLWEKATSQKQLDGALVLHGLTGSDRPLSANRAFTYSRRAADGSEAEAEYASPEGLVDVLTEWPITGEGLVGDPITTIGGTAEWTGIDVTSFSEEPPHGPNGQGQYVFLKSDAAQSVAVFGQVVGGTGGFSRVPTPLTYAGLCSVRPILMPADDRNGAGSVLDEPLPNLLIGTDTGLAMATDRLNVEGPGSTWDYTDPDPFTSLSGHFCNIASFTGEADDPLLSYDPQTAALVQIDPAGENGVPVLASAPDLAFRPTPDQALIAMGAGHDAEARPYAALLFSDGVHAGQHTLVIRLTNEAEIMPPTEIEIALPAGIPTAMSVTRADPGASQAGTGHDDILIAVPETPYVYHIELNDLAGTSGGDPYTLSFFEAGFGVTDLWVSPGDTAPGALMTLHDTGVLRLWPTLSGSGPTP